jgi:hypothetical protein
MEAGGAFERASKRDAPSLQNTRKRQKTSRLSPVPQKMSENVPSVPGSPSPVPPVPSPVPPISRRLIAAMLYFVGVVGRQKQMPNLRHPLSPSDSDVYCHLT